MVIYFPDNGKDNYEGIKNSLIQEYIENGVFPVIVTKKGKLNE